MAHANSQPTAQTAKAPDYLAWHVTQRNDKSYWTKVGAAWSHKDGKGISVQLDSHPIDGRIVLREPLEDQDDGKGRV